MQPHVFKPIGSNRMYDWEHCATCNLLSDHPLHIMTLPGMEGSDQQREEARQLQQAEELTARLIEARPSIDAKAGEMEANSPLFYGTIHPTLF